MSDGARGTTLSALRKRFGGKKVGLEGMHIPLILGILWADPGDKSCRLKQFPKEKKVGLHVSLKKCECAEIMNVPENCGWLSGSWEST